MGNYQQTINVSESFQETDTGNANSGAITRDGQGSGSYDNSLGGSGSLDDSFHETGNGTAGGISETYSGTSRYNLLVSWVDASQGSGSNGTGNVDLTPWGAPYSERDPQSVWHRTGASNAPLTPGDGGISAGNALGQALDSARFQSGYLNGSGLAVWQSGSARVGWDAQEAYTELGTDLYAQACFLPGTPLLTPNGSKAIEQFQTGDAILSREERDPDGPIEVKIVEEVFVRHGRIWHLHVGDQVIGLTAEHPLFVKGRGWVPCGSVEIGDALVGHDLKTVTVADLIDSGEFATVYNLRVSDYHTYFVGSRDWDFSLWRITSIVVRGWGRLARHRPKSFITCWPGVTISLSGTPTTAAMREPI